MELHEKMAKVKDKKSKAAVPGHAPASTWLDEGVWLGEVGDVRLLLFVRSSNTAPDILTCMLQHMSQVKVWNYFLI